MGDRRDASRVSIRRTTATLASGHIGGLIGGILITLGYAHWRGGRAQYGQMGLGGAVALVVVAVGSVALAYFKVRGYA